MSGGAHLKIERLPKPKRRKTEIWGVFDEGYNPLGEIRWWSSWRRYTFHPMDGTLYGAFCLQTLSKFCDEETRKRKAARKLERANADD